MADIWQNRRRMQKHFEAALLQAMLHDMPTEVIMQGLVLAVHDLVAEPKATLADAWQAVDL